MRLKIKWTEYVSKSEKLISKGNDIFLKENATKETDFDKIKVEIKEWKNEVIEFLKTSFEPQNNDYAKAFKNSNTPRYNFNNQAKSFREVKKETFQELSVKIKNLTYYQRILSISDIVIKSDEIDFNKRALFDTEKILDLILEKLYILYDNSYHSVLMILEGNGIEIKRYGEEREYIKLLESYGYVKAMHSRDVSAQLTTEGKIYIEQKIKAASIDYDRISNSQNEINQKIDEIINTLTKLGLGQEILFEELVELKDLYGKINKKNWGQILKGKLIDLGLSQIINKETVGLIYKELTEQIFKLP